MCQSRFSKMIWISKCIHVCVTRGVVFLHTCQINFRNCLPNLTSRLTTPLVIITTSSDKAYNLKHVLLGLFCIRNLTDDWKKNPGILKWLLGKVLSSIWRMWLGIFNWCGPRIKRVASQGIKEYNRGRSVKRYLGVSEEQKWNVQWPMRSRRSIGHPSPGLEC